MSAKYVSAKCSSRFLLTLQLRVCLASVFNFFLVATLRLCCDVSGKAPSSLLKLLVLLPQTQLEMAHLAVAGHCPEVSPTFVATNMAGDGLNSHRKHLVPTSIWKYPVVSPLQMLQCRFKLRLPAWQPLYMQLHRHPLHLSMWKPLNKHVSKVHNINLDTQYLSACLHESTFLQYPAAFPFFFFFLFLKKLCCC